MKRLLGLILIALMMFNVCTALAEELPAWVREDPSSIGDRIVVYTALDASERQTVEELWHTYYPDCTIEWVSDSMGRLVDRVREAADATEADVIMGGLSEVDGTAYHDILQQYTPAVAGELSSIDPYGFYSFFDVQCMALVVNETLASEIGVEINGYADLLNPLLKGKIIQADPASSDSGYLQLQTMLALMGEDFADDQAWEYVDQLIANCDGALTMAPANVVKGVLDGEYVVGLTYESLAASMIAEAGAEDIRLVYPSEGNTACASGAGMVKNCPHYEAAAAFLDFCASAEYQQARYDAHFARGANTAVLCGDYPSMDDLGLISVDWEAVANQKAALIEGWTERWQ